MHPILTQDGRIALFSSQRRLIHTNASWSRKDPSTDSKDANEEAEVADVDVGVGVGVGLSWGKGYVILPSLLIEHRICPPPLLASLVAHLIPHTGSECLPVA